MSRLTIDITDQQHKNLKALAALQGKIIKQYALERLFPDATSGDQAWLELKSLLDEPINDGLAGKISTKSIGNILNDELASSGHS